MNKTSLIPDVIDKPERMRNKPAFIEPGRVVSFAEADAEICACAAFLLESGLNPGDRVAVLMPNSWAYVRTFYGAIRAGLIPAVFHPKTAPGEVEHLMNIAEPSGLVADVRLMKRLADAIAPWANRFKLVAVDADGGKVESIADKIGCEIVVLSDELTPEKAEVEGFPRPDPDDGALIIFTTGTTGRPKGVLLSHRNILSVAEAIVDCFRITPNDTTLIINPLAHISACTSQMVAYPMVGATCCIERDLSLPREVLRFAGENDVTSLHGMPASMAILLRNISRGEKPLPSLRFIGLSGERVTRKLLDKLLGVFPGVEIYNSYGLTEAAPRVTAVRIDNDPDNVGTVGQPLPLCEVMVVDELGNRLPSGQVGELLVKSPGNMKCYFNDEEATADAFLGEWLHTGDLAKLDESGHIYLEARISEMINVGGEKVNPLEVEEAIDAVPGVESSLVVKKEHEIMGEVPIALIKLQKGADLDEGEILRQIKPRLSAFKIPVKVHFVREFPSTEGGKSIRRLPEDLEGLQA